MSNEKELMADDVVQEEVMEIDDQSTEVNPFADPSSLWVSQDYGQQLPTQKLITTIAVTKPSSQVFFRCHPDNDFHREFNLLHFEEDRETYLVVPSLSILLERHVKQKRLYFCMTKGGSLCLWPVSTNTGQNIWIDSAHQIAKEAQRSWVQLVSNKDLGGYVAAVPETQWPDPQWPDLELSDILEKSFRGRFIDNPEHEVVLKLQGAM
jgi:hypothetical protein